MNQQSWLCSACGRTQASIFCCCTGKETFLCEPCFIQHFTKNIGRIHLNIPVKFYGQQKVPGYFDRLQQRAVNIPSGKEGLLKKLEAVDTCMGEFNSKIENIISTLRQYAQETMSKLQQVKVDLERDINAAIAEVEETMYMDNPPLENKFSRQLRDFKPDTSGERLFSYEIDKSPYPASLANILHFSQGRFSGTGWVPHVLPGVAGNTLRLYELGGGNTKQVTLSKAFTQGTMYCVVDEQIILCVGGYPPVQDMYSLCLSTNQLTQLPSMTIARAWSGIHRHGDYVYSFGGYYPNTLSSSEKYCMTSRTWCNLPNMSYPRHGFNPSEYQGEVYLPDVYQSHKVLESFNIASETFKTLPIPLSSFNSALSVSIILDGELLIITTTQVGRYRIQSAETNFRVSQITSTGVTHKLSSCPPVLVGRELHFILYDSGNLRKFNVDTQILT